MRIIELQQELFNRISIEDATFLNAIKKLE